MDDLPEARLFTLYEWDCPVCSEVIREEGDTRGDVVECFNCETKVRIY